MLRSFLCAAVILAALPAYANQYTHGGLAITYPWAQPTVRAKTAAVFLTVDNNGLEDDVLMGGISPLADRVEVHETIWNREGSGALRLRTRKVEKRLPLPAGESIELRPGGYHLVLTGLALNLEAGQSVPLTLSFARSGDVVVDVKIEWSPSKSAQAGRRN